MAPKASGCALTSVAQPVGCPTQSLPDRGQNGIVGSEHLVLARSFRPPQDAELESGWVVIAKVHDQRLRTGLGQGSRYLTNGAEDT